MMIMSLGEAMLEYDVSSKQNDAGLDAKRHLGTFSKHNPMCAPRMPRMPNWVPREAQHYLDHTENGLTIRALARKGGCAPSTIMRQVRKVEQKRDDPLIDEVLTSLRQCDTPQYSDMIARNTAPHEHTPYDTRKDTSPMSKHTPLGTQSGLTLPTDATIEREARRILRRLNETGACLAVAKDMEKAVVVRDLPDGRTTRTAVLDRPIAQALALKEWISPQEKGKITRYTITAAGRAALKRFVAADESQRAGFSEGPTSFEGAQPVWGVDATDTLAAAKETGSRVRYNVAESPVVTLARRRDKDGDMFLSPELVAAAERLREDFELALMGASGAPKGWDEYLSGAAHTQEPPAGYGPDAARVRVGNALVDLGPGLADVALRCCCYLEGMEQAEKRMGWPARSGKIVLRIALQRLKRHYAKAGYSNLIG
jgi:hypothetical protein